MVTFLEHQLTESMVYDVILKRRLDWALFSLDYMAVAICDFVYIY